VTVVGDDAQSIYSFRAATVRNILDFPAQFTSAAHVVTLERNYRSTQSILEASNAVIDMASERFAKNLWTERMSSEKPQLIAVRDEVEQARCVAERILEYRETGIALKSQAVLFRSSSHSAQLELELTRRDIPFVKFGGLKFLEAAHVKDILCVLRWAENPRSRMAGFRVARLLPGIGPATASKLIDVRNRANSQAGVVRYAASQCGRLAGVGEPVQAFATGEFDLACRGGPGRTMVRAASAANLRGRTGSTGRPRAAPANRLDVSFARALSDRADTGSAERPSAEPLHQDSTMTISFSLRSILRKGRNGKQFMFSTSSTAACLRT
jgi:hypothetical protein